MSVRLEQSFLLIRQAQIFRNYGSTFLLCPLTGSSGFSSHKTLQSCPVLESRYKRQ